MITLATTVTIALLLVLAASAIAAILVGFWFVARAAWRAILTE